MKKEERTDAPDTMWGAAGTFTYFPPPACEMCLTISISQMRTLRLRGGRGARLVISRVRMEPSPAGLTVRSPTPPAPCPHSQLLLPLWGWEHSAQLALTHCWSDVGEEEILSTAPKGESPLLSLLRSPQNPRTSAACDQHSFASLLTEEGGSAVLAGPQETPPLQRWQGQAGGKALAQAKLRSGKEGEKNSL